MTSLQPSLFEPVPAWPDGFDYRPGLVTPEEEAALIAQIAALPLKPAEFRGFLALRRVVYFGWRYDPAGGEIGRIEPIPAFLAPLRAAAAAFAGLEAVAFAHALVTEYQPGATIGWHRDRPEFGDVAGVSLGAPALLRFRRGEGKGWERASQRLEPRSVYLMRGPARSEWRHSIPAGEGLRYSVTFRTLAGGRA